MFSNGFICKTTISTGSLTLIMTMKCPFLDWVETVVE